MDLLRFVSRVLTKEEPRTLILCLHHSHPLRLAVSGHDPQTLGDLVIGILK